MQTVCFKEHGGIFHNSFMPTLPLPSGPWWGSQSVYGDSFGHLKPVAVNHPRSGNVLGGNVVPQGTLGAEQVPRKENHNTSQFTIIPGECKDPVKEQTAQQGNLSRQSSQSGFQTCFELGLGQPMVCTNYPYIDQYYRVLATYGTQSAAGRIMLPLNVKSEDGPIFVNAKQYHGILRRRQSRAKAELENKLVKGRKPYLHESRHLHALRRARGCGGRFLTKNAKNGKGGSVKEKSGEHRRSPLSGSSSSEVLQSEGRNVNASKDFYRSESSLSGYEVTSMYTRGDLSHFRDDHLHSSAFHSLSNIIDIGQGINTSNRWVTAADGRCDFLKV